MAAVVHEPQSTDLLRRQIASHMHGNFGQAERLPGCTTQVADNDHVLGVHYHRLAPPVLPNGTRNLLDRLRAPRSGVLWIILGSINRPHLDFEVGCGLVHWITSGGS